MNKNKDLIPGLLFHTAQGFYDIALNCAYNVTKDNEITGFQRIAPAAVNICFTAELLLKGLLLISTEKKIRGHYLKSLFDDLPEMLKLQIRARYMYHQKEDKGNKDFGSFKFVVTKANEKSKNIEDNDEISLDKLLTSHNRGFENWRYLYEIEKNGVSYDIDFKSMNCFIKAMMETIDSLPQNRRLYITKAKSIKKQMPDESRSI